MTSWVTPYSAGLSLHASRSPQMSISCWMLSLFSVMSNPRLLMSCCILYIQVALAAHVFLDDGFSASISSFVAGTFGSSHIRWPIQEWRRLTIVLLHGSSFISLYSLAFEITRKIATVGGKYYKEEKVKDEFIVKNQLIVFDLWTLQLSSWCFQRTL